MVEPVVCRSSTNPTLGDNVEADDVVDLLASTSVRAPGL